MSDPIKLRQGVRQGGVLSTSHYKRYNNTLLLQMEDRFTDVKIGSINIPHITVVDDLAVMSRKTVLNRSKSGTLITIQIGKRYCLNPVKSYPYAKNTDFECTDIFMAGDKISNDSSTTHLGIHREVTDKPNIEGKINLGKKTANSIMCLEFHSGNWLKVC